MVPTVFFLGAAAGAALIIGLWFTKKGLSRGYRRRKEVRNLRQRVEATTTPSDSSAGADSTPEPAADPAIEGDERLATEPHTVADGPESRPATQRRPDST
jgi:hypothetical protein